MTGSSFPRSGPILPIIRAHPGKSTVLALAVALKLDLADTADLLARAEYALSPGSVGDLIVRYFIEHGIYDLQVINTALNEYDQPILG